MLAENLLKVIACINNSVLTPVNSCGVAIEHSINNCSVNNSVNNLFFQVFEIEKIG